ncbi:high mobility group B3 [Euphorbia peplus]|nr:high mobility group B3 [Euphorbia peplus]
MNVEKDASNAKTNSGKTKVSAEKTNLNVGSSQSKQTGGKSNANTKGSMLFVIKKPFKPVKIIGAVKDPNEPKRPPSAFFVFMEEFRQTYQKEHPQNKSAAAVGMAGGNKWKALSKAEKGMFAAMAEKRKVEYEKKIVA